MPAGGNGPACFRIGRSANLERNVVVEVAVESGGGARLLFAAAAAPEAAAIVGALVIVAAAARAALVEQHELAAEALQHDLGRIAVLAVIVLPLAGLDLALEIDLRSLAQILLGDAAEILVEDHHAVPFGPLLAVAVAVLPALRGGDAEVDHLAAAVERARLGVLPEIADQYDLV